MDVCWFVTRSQSDYWRVSLKFGMKIVWNLETFLSRNFHGKRIPRGGTRWRKLVHNKDIVMSFAIWYNYCTYIFFLHIVSNEIAYHWHKINSMSLHYNWFFFCFKMTSVISTDDNQNQTKKGLKEYFLLTVFI